MASYSFQVDFDIDLRENHNKDEYAQTSYIAGRFKWNFFGFTNDSHTNHLFLRSLNLFAYLIEPFPTTQRCPLRYGMDCSELDYQNAFDDSPKRPIYPKVKTPSCMLYFLRQKSVKSANILSIPRPYYFQGDILGVFGLLKTTSCMSSLGATGRLQKLEPLCIIIMQRKDYVQRFLSLPNLCLADESQGRHFLHVIVSHLVRKWDWTGRVSGWADEKIVQGFRVLI